MDDIPVCDATVNDIAVYDISVISSVVLVEFWLSSGIHPSSIQHSCVFTCSENVCVHLSWFSFGSFLFSGYLICPGHSVYDVRLIFAKLNKRASIVTSYRWSAHGVALPSSGRLAQLSSSFICAATSVKLCWCSAPLQQA